MGSGALYDDGSASDTTSQPAPPSGWVDPTGSMSRGPRRSRVDTAADASRESRAGRFTVKAMEAVKSLEAQP